MKFATMPRLRNVTAALLVGLALLLAAGTAAPAADLISTHGDWKAYRHGSGDMLLCYAVTSASEQLPPGGNRQKPHIYITAWPKAGIKTEISVLVGTVLRRGAEIKIDVGGSSFSLQPDGDRAFVVDQVEEQRLLEAMRRGKVLTVATTTAPGETMRDTYSLSGVTAAVQAAAAGCQ
jgi:invasion protein IalB